jgi:hypothetical protein
MPAWHFSKYDPREDGMAGLTVLGPLYWLLFPLVWVLVQLPVAAIRPLFSDTRWVEASSVSEGDMKLVWETSKEHAEGVAEHVAQTLPRGYEDLTPATAELIHVTRPPGLGDLFR